MTMSQGNKLPPITNLILTSLYKCPENSDKVTDDKNDPTSKGYEYLENTMKHNVLPCPLLFLCHYLLMDPLPRATKYRVVRENV